MKTIILFLLLAGLTACSGIYSHRYRHPAVVTGTQVPVRESLLPDSPIIMTVSQGDTLELRSIDPSGLCQVAPRADRGRFPGAHKAGYIQRRFLLIPDSTLARVQVEGILH